MTSQDDTSDRDRVDGCVDGQGAQPRALARGGAGGPPLDDLHFAEAMEIWKDRPLRLLIVQAHEGMRSALRLLLTRVGHSVQTADSITAARKLLQADGVDVAICGRSMPDGDPLDLIHELVNDHAISVIVLSGLYDPEEIARSRQAGACVHLLKPARLGDLSWALEVAVNRLSPPV